MKSSPFIVTALLSCFASSAYAQPPDPAAAQTLFYEGRALMQQGRLVEACAKLEESQRLDAGIGTEFNLAECQERVGKIATAWANFLEVAAQSKASGQAAREKVARQRAQALETRLPKLVLDVQRPPPGMDVKRDGEVIGAASWNTPIPVDPGVHEIVVNAPGKVAWETSVTVAEGRTAHVTVPSDLASAPLAAVAPVPVQTTPSPRAEPVSTQVSFPPAVDEDRGSTQRVLGYVAGVAGIAGLGVGGFFGLRALNKRDDSRSHCSGDVCDADGVSLRSDAMHAGDIATIATIAGGAAVLGGILLLATAPSHEGIRATPQVGTNGGGMLVQGSFQ